MPRAPRIHAPGALYHVTLRGNHRQHIFFQPDDRRLLTGMVTEAIGKCGAHVHAYCYMTNHIHVLIQVADTPLSKIMLLIAGRYARAVQERFDTTGHLFEKRYHAVLVDADRYLLALVRYIHLNPVRANLVASPDDYPWSSHHSYLQTRVEPWVTTSLALSMLDADRARAIAAYDSFVRRAPAASPLVERNSRDPRILGSDAFARAVLGSKWRPSADDALGRIVHEGCTKFAVTLAELQSPSRLAEVVRARAWVTQQAVSRDVASLSAVARYLQRDPSSLRSLRRRHVRD